MKKTAINPVDWGLQFHMNQAELVEGVTKLLHCSGQTAIVPDSSAEMGVSVAHAGDMPECELAHKPTRLLKKTPKGHLDSIALWS